MSSGETSVAQRIADDNADDSCAPRRAAQHRQPASMVWDATRHHVAPMLGDPPAASHASANNSALSRRCLNVWQLRPLLADLDIAVVTFRAPMVCGGVGRPE